MLVVFGGLLVVALVLKGLAKVGQLGTPEYVCGIGMKTPPSRGHGPIIAAVVPGSAA